MAILVYCSKLVVLVGTDLLLVEISSVRKIGEHLSASFLGAVPSAEAPCLVQGD